MRGDVWTAVIIEDDPDVRDLIDIVLTQSGFTTVVAENGVEGVEAVRAHNPLITTLDVNMPGMDGFAAAKRLREFSNTYLIMITALADEIDVVQGFEAGADDYLVKPFRPRELRARADSMLRRPRARADQPVGWAGDDDGHEEGAGASVRREPPRKESWAAVAARELAANAPLRSVRHDGAPARSAPVEPTAPQPAPPQQPQPVVPPPQPAYQPQHAAPPPAPPAYAPPAPPTPPAFEPPAAFQPPAGTPAAPAEPVSSPQAAAPADAHAAAHHSGDPSVEDAWVRFNGLALNHETRVVTVGGGAVDLSRTEFDLLASLLDTGRRVRSKADLVLTMRGQQYVTSYFVNEADKRSVEVHIANLRRKIGDDGATPRFIETVRGVGYRLAEAV